MLKMKLTDGQLSIIWLALDNEQARLERKKQSALRDDEIRKVVEAKTAILNKQTYRRKGDQK